MVFWNLKFVKGMKRLFWYDEKGRFFDSPGYMGVLDKEKNMKDVLEYMGYTKEEIDEKEPKQVWFKKIGDSYVSISEVYIRDRGVAFYKIQVNFIKIAGMHTFLSFELVSEEYLLENIKEVERSLKDDIFSKFNKGVV